MPRNDPEYERGFTDGFNAGTRFQAERTPPSDAEQLSELRKLAQTSLDLLNDVYNSRASQRFSAIGLSRIQSHMKELRAVLAPKQQEAKETE